MKKLFILLIVSLFFPLSSAYAFSWTSPLHSELGTPGNPLRVQITNVNDFRPPSYCNYLPSFAAGWSQFSSCASVVAQRNLQSALQQMNENIYQQNKLAQEAQRWNIFNSLRTVFVPTPIVHTSAPVVQNVAPSVSKTETDAIQSVVDQVAAAGGAPAQKSVTGLPDLWTGIIMNRNGNSLSFTITVANLGGQNATNVRLTPSSVPAVVRFDGLSSNSWYLGTIAGGETKSVIYTASVSDTSASVVIKVTATGNENDKNAADNTDTITLIPTSGGSVGGSGGSGGSI